MGHNTIALICDCDETLCPDTSNALIEAVGFNAGRFWGECAEMVATGWDPPLAYLSHLVDLSQQGKGPRLSLAKLQEVGRSVTFYRGVPQFLTRLRGALDQNAEYRDAGIQLEWYVVSGGIEELLQATSIARHATDIFGCTIAYDSAGFAP